MFSNKFVLPALTLVASILAGCGSGGSDTPNRPAPESQLLPALENVTERLAPPVHPSSLEQALGQIDAAAVPAGVADATFGELKSALRVALENVFSDDGTIDAAKYASAPIAEVNDPRYLQCTGLPDSTVTLIWKGQHVGDYNLDGAVGVADITPLAIHYQKNPQIDEDGFPVENGDNEWAAIVDGNGDGEINISDITMIAIYFNSSLAGYRVYLGRSVDGAETTWDGDYQPSGVAGQDDISIAFNNSRDQARVHLYEFTFTLPELEDNEKLYARIVPFNGTAEGIFAEMEVVLGGHAIFKCEICHNITDMSFRGIDEACRNCHSTPPGFPDNTWADAPPIHGDCFFCHSNHGYVSDPPYSPCTKCHSTNAAESAAAGMPDCLGCHISGHIPNLTPSADDCGSCHAGIPAQLPAGPMQDCKLCHDDHTFTMSYSTEFCQGCHPTPPLIDGAIWDDAPGAHSNCYACHPEHEFGPEAPGDVCITCHGDKAAAGHGAGSYDCLGCHANPHVPNTSMEQSVCQDCHIAPPEDNGTEWIEAPGLHSQCMQCHPGPEHGNKPVPAESICINCHSTKPADGHAGGSADCLTCHSSPHVPDFNITEDDCKTCHTNPPEDLGREWIEAPGMHGNCLLCHSGTEHGVKPVPAESVCGNCHQVKIDAGHVAGYTQCLDCHGMAHLPVVNTVHGIHNMSGYATCVDCHGVSGSDAPTRDTCMVCHTDKAAHHDPTLCSECHGNS